MHRDLGEDADASNRDLGGTLGPYAARLLGSPEIPYTKDIPTFFAGAFAQICGGEIVGTDTYEIGQIEFGPQLAKIQNTDPRRTRSSRRSSCPARVRF